MECHVVKDPLKRKLGDLIVREFAFKGTRLINIYFISRVPKR